MNVFVPLTQAQETIRATLVEQFENAASSEAADQIAKDQLETSPSSYILMILLGQVALRGSGSAARLLVQKGAEINIMSIYNAILNPSESVPILQAFIDAGWDVNTVMKHQGDALVQAVYYNNVGAVRLLLKSGAHPTLNEGSNGRTTLGDAAVYASPEIISMLIESGAEIEKSRALELAARFGRRDNVEHLLKKGADINEVPDEKTWNFVSNEDREAGLGSALHAAAFAGHSDVVSLLLEKKANVLLEDSKGRTALRRAIMGWHPYVAALLSVALLYAN